MTTGTEATRGHRCRAATLGGLLALALLAAAAVTGRVTAAQTESLVAQPRLTVDDAVPLVALAVLVAGLLWLALLVLVSSRDLVRRGPAGPQADRPLGLHGPLATRVAGLLLAATAFGSVASPPGSASAQPTTGVTVSAGAVAGDHHSGSEAPDPDFAPAEARSGTAAPTCPAPEPGWSTRGPGLQRPATTDQAGLLGRCSARSGDEVVVHRGDSLWSIVERELGPDAGPQEIAARWPAWYTANRDAIGSDPDLLLPGTVLHRPNQEVLR